MKTKLDYTEAYQKLEVLVKQLEQGGIGLNELTEQVKKANELIAICEGQLRQIEKDVIAASEPAKTKAKKKKE